MHSHSVHDPIKRNSLAIFTTAQHTATSKDMNSGPN